MLFQQPTRCSICRPHLDMYGATFSLCVECHGEAKGVIDLMKELQVGEAQGTDKPFGQLCRWMHRMKNANDDLEKRTSFLSGFLVAFKEQIHTDLQLKPGSGEPCIPAHMAVLAAKSDVFKNLLDSDGCKAPPHGPITFPELNGEQLDSLLEFLYSGSLPPLKLAKHVYSLSAVADKYEIPYLLEVCERHMLNSLNLSSALDVLEFSETYQKTNLKEASSSFILRNMNAVVSSAKYEEWMLKNPGLCLEVTRAFFASRTNSNAGTS